MGHSFAGVVFDMDGTLVDSHETVDHCWGIVARMVGALDDGEEYRGSELFVPGLPASSSIRLMLERAQEKNSQAAAGEEEVLYWTEFHKELELSDAWRASPLPYAEEVLSFLEERAVPWGVATSCTSELGVARWEASGLVVPAVFHTFERDYFKGKPDGDAFRSAAEKLGLLGSSWIVVEDAVAGVQSGVNAGGFVVGVEGSYPREKLLEAGASVVFKDLRDLKEWLSQIQFVID